jgi:hypothetical protein
MDVVEKRQLDFCTIMQVMINQEMASEDGANRNPGIRGSEAGENNGRCATHGAEKGPSDV